MAERKTEETSVEASLESETAVNAQPELQRSTIPRRHFVNDMPDRGLFIIISMAGFAAIVTAKLYAYNASHVAIGAVGLMIVYAIIAYRIARLRLRADRLGDNFYYLGFIFTLASLSAALIELQGNVQKIESVLGSFGIALVTTIVGIAGRVMFVQMRGEIDEIEAASRRDLLVTSEALRAQLALTLTEFQVLQTGMRQASSEIIESTKAFSESQVEALSEASKAAAASVEKAFSVNQGVAEGIHAAVQETLQSARQITEKVEKMQLPSAQLEAEIARLSSEVDDMLSRLGQLVTVIARERGARDRWFFGLFRRRAI